ncbi:hypothetical protein ACFFOU_28770 [Pseudonocardia sulfidoxydans]|nr:hypothetical protein [Pseudonocardia sulfidoxydans]
MINDCGVLVELRALVGCVDVMRAVPLCRPASRVAPLEQDLAMIPLPAGSCGAVAGSRAKMMPRLGFRWMTPGVYAALIHASYRGPIGYFEIEYTAYSGWEAAAVWVEGVLAYGPEHSAPLRTGPLGDATPVAEALRRLGALVDEVPDEVVTVGLDRFRCTKDWFAAASEPAR